MSRWMNGWVGWKKNLKFVFCRTGHPIRLVLDREDDMLITGGRHPLFGKYKVSIKEQNTKVSHFIWMVLPFPIIFIFPNWGKEIYSMTAITCKLSIFYKLF